MTTLNDQEQKAVKKVIEAINHKRQRAITEAYNPKGEIQTVLTEEKKNRWYQKPVGQAGWQKIASIPMEVDQWFTKMYGADYYKNPDFFTKMYPEWRVVAKPRG